MKEFFTKEFLELNDQEKWDVLTALRGPDNGNPKWDELKYLITARIRGAVISEREPSIYSLAGFTKGYRYETSPMTFEQHERAAELLSILQKEPQSFHFFNHLKKALRVLEHHPIWGGYASTLFYVIMP